MSTAAADVAVDVGDADADESLVASSAASISVVSVVVGVAAGPSISIGSDDIVVVVVVVDGLKQPCPSASSANRYHVARCCASKLHRSMIGQSRCCCDGDTERTCFNFRSHLGLDLSSSWLIRQNFSGTEATKL